MTVAAQVADITYAENGVTTEFAAPFRYQDPSNLLVTRQAADGTIVILPFGTGFTATAGDTDAGGEVTPASISTGTKLRIRRVTPRAQTAEYATGDRYPAALTEGALDVAMLVAQEIQAQLDDTTERALLVTVGESGFVLPIAAARAGFFFGFDAAGNPAMLTGTGADEGLRTDLAAATGVALIGDFSNVPSTPSISATFAPDGSTAKFNTVRKIALTSATQNEIIDWVDATNSVPTGGGKAYVVLTGGILRSLLGTATGYAFNYVWESHDVPGCGGEVDLNLYGATTYGAAYGESTANTISVWRAAYMAFGGASGATAQKAMTAYHCEAPTGFPDQFYRGYNARGCSLIAYSDPSNASLSYYAEGTKSAGIDISLCTISSGDAIRLPNNTAISWKTPSGTLAPVINFTAGSDLQVGFFAARTLYGSSLAPGQDNVFTLGTASLAPANIYSHNAMIVVSDAETKTDDEPISDDLALAIVKAVEPRSYLVKIGGYTARTETVTTKVPQLSVSGEQVLTYEPVLDASGNPVMDEVPDFGDSIFETVEIDGKKVEVRKRYVPGVTPTKLVAKTKAIPVMVDGQVEQTVYDERAGKRRHLGFFAQDVQAAFVAQDVDFGAYVEMEDGTKALRHGEMLPLLWKAVQAQQATIEALTTRVAALEARPSAGAAS